MQKMENNGVSATAYGNHGVYSSKSQDDANVDDFASMYSSLVMAQPEATISQNSYSDPTLHDSLYSSFLIRQQQQQQHQDMINRQNLYLTSLREAAREVEDLRQENASLRSVNREINKHMSLLIKSSLSEYLSCGKNDPTTSFGMVNALRGLSIAGGGGDGREEGSVESPASVTENVEVKRISLPKSISVRSNGYLKLGPPAAATPTTKTLPRTPAPLKPTQKVYVKGGKQEEEPLELEVYNQGMFKTELCNKWQETGACPYGDHCQFAHGIEELRPVIRHPRYKTEVCRMVLAGDACPYGHRCHFRHALTEQERLIGHLTPR